jgi:beta-galactosidase
MLPLSTLRWKVVYASSEEVTAANNDADKLFDQQESTWWQSRAVGGKAPYPHQVLIDLGGIETIRGMRLLPRADKKGTGAISEYRVFLKQVPFRL